MHPLPDSDNIPRPARHKRPAFLWTFGACVASTAALTAALAFIPLPGYGGLSFMAVMPVVWMLALLVGWAVWFNGRENGSTGATRMGLDIVLGALAGALVGFSLCSGALGFGAWVVG